MKCSSILETLNPRSARSLTGAVSASQSGRSWRCQTQAPLSEFIPRACGRSHEARPHVFQSSAYGALFEDVISKLYANDSSPKKLSTTM